MNEHPANLIELFSSIQGEGLHVGHRQVFLRFHGCNLSCSYCDTLIGTPSPSASLERTPGRRDFLAEANPVPLARIVDLLHLWLTGWPGIHHSISITGGEPLLNHHLLQEWLPRLRDFLPIYLETNGTLHHVLESVIEHIDYVSMDIKLPSTSGCTDLWEKHREFLRASRVKQVFVKLVISDETEDWEIHKACDIIASVDTSIPCVLQPVTSVDGTIAISPLKVLELQELVAGCLSEVRVIPQTHRFMHQL